MTGYVKFFDPRRRFGIIVPDGIAVSDRERTVFFYEDVLENGIPREGNDVEYSLNPNYRSPRALTVKLLSKRAYIPIKGGGNFAAD